MFIRLIFIILSLSLRLTKVLSRNTCYNNNELTELGCNCKGFNLLERRNDKTKKLLFINRDECLNGYVNLNCIFDKEIIEQYSQELTSKLNNNNNDNENKSCSLDLVNYIDIVVHNLGSFTQTCLYEMKFKNVFIISSKLFQHLHLRSINTNTKNNKILIEFTNIYQINSFAFESIKLNNNESLTIRLDGYFNLKCIHITNTTTNNGLVLKSNSFSNINRLNLLHLKNFKSSSLKLNKTLFNNSFINTILIENSIIDEFINDDYQLSLNINNLTIKNCFLIKNLNLNLFINSKLDNLIIKNSALTNLDLLNQLFIDNSHNDINKLKIIDLSSNLIKEINTENEKALFNLNNLISLNLENNPIEYFNLSSNLSIKKLNLKNNRLNYFNLSNHQIKLNNLTQLILDDNLNLLDDNLLRIIFNQIPNIEYLSLKSTGLVNKYDKNLNYLLDKIDDELIMIKNLSKDSSVKKLKYIHLNNRLNLSVFLNDFNLKGLCLWNNLLNQTFIHVDLDHECDCSLIYLYRNLHKYLIPIENNGDNDDNDVLIELFKYKKSNYLINRFSLISSLVPKCLIRYFIENEDFNFLKNLSKTCGFMTNNDYPLNCDQFRKTTTLTTKTITTDSMNRNLSTTNLIDINEDILINKKLVSFYTIPLLIVSFVLIIILIGFFVFKARYDYSNKFMNVYKKVLVDSVKEPKEMNDIFKVTQTSIAINLNDKFQIEENLQ